MVVGSMKCVELVWLSEYQLVYKDTTSWDLFVL